MRQEGTADTSNHRRQNVTTVIIPVCYHRHQPLPRALLNARHWGYTEPNKAGTQPWGS